MLEKFRPKEGHLRNAGWPSGKSDWGIADNLICPLFMTVSYRSTASTDAVQKKNDRGMHQSALVYQDTGVQVTKTLGYR